MVNRIHIALECITPRRVRQTRYGLFGRFFPRRCKALHWQTVIAAITTSEMTLPLKALPRRSLLSSEKTATRRPASRRWQECQSTQKDVLSGQRPFQGFGAPRPWRFKTGDLVNGKRVIGTFPARSFQQPGNQFTTHD